MYVFYPTASATAKGRSFSGPNIRLRPKVKIVPTVQHWWGHKKKCGKRKPRKSRLLSSTKGEENRIEL